MEKPEPTVVDLLIRNAWIVTMDAGRRSYRDGAVAMTTVTLRSDIAA